MAIQFARIRFISRSGGGNACRSSAYNARDKIVNEKTGEVFNWTQRGGNIYHEILLPDHVDKKFKNASVLSNEVEVTERKGNSQLYAEFLLPLDKDLDPNNPKTLEIYKDHIHDYIRRKGWIKEGLGVQIDIHKPHEGEDNYHCHGLVTTRRFLDTGLGFEKTKARDIFPQIRNGLVTNKEDFDNGIIWRDVQNDYYKACGMSNRVDLPGILTQEHIGPVRMRSVFNEAAKRNEDKKEAEIEHLNSGDRVVNKVAKHMSVFTKGDLARAVKCIPDDDSRAKLFSEALESDSLVPLYTKDGTITKYFTTHEIRLEEQKLMRLGGYVFNEENLITSLSGRKWSRGNVERLISEGSKGLSDEQSKALSIVD